MNHVTLKLTFVCFNVRWCTTFDHARSIVLNDWSSFPFSRHLIWLCILNQSTACLAWAAFVECQFLVYSRRGLFKPTPKDPRASLGTHGTHRHKKGERRQTLAWPLPHGALKELATYAKMHAIGPKSACARGYFHFSRPR